MRSLAVEHFPPAGQTVIQVCRAPEKGKQFFTILSDALWGCWSHWCGDHTEACFCTNEERDLVDGPHKHRWKGFLHVVNNTTGREWFLEISRDAASMFLSKLGERDPMRGLMIAVHREPQTKRGAILIEPYDRVREPEKLPTHRTPETTLKKLWKIKNLPCGQNAA